MGIGNAAAFWPKEVDQQAQMTNIPRSASVGNDS